MEPESQQFIVIGAGVAGIAMGVQLRRKLRTDDFEIYDKLDRVGGVWALNSYPNLYCDVAAQSYQFSFNLKADWPEKFASRGEILKYLDETVTKFDLNHKIRLQQECVSAIWSSTERLWEVKFQDLNTEAIYTRKARFLITAVGQLSIPRGVEDVPGLEKFKGDIVSTARWRDLPFTGKDVLLIGNGASANQVVPWLLNDAKVKTLVQISRSPQWYAIKSNHRIWAVTKWILRYIPGALRLYRLLIITGLDLLFQGMRTSRLGNLMRLIATKEYTTYIKQAPQKYHSKLVPTYPIGQKRPLADHGYIECTKRDNFDLVQGNGIAGVSEDGHSITDTDGNVRKPDIVVLANGWKTTSMTAPMKIIGEDGTELKEHWKKAGGIRAYMGVSISTYPNLFLLGGPNTFQLGNVLLNAECSVSYILRVLSRILPPPPSSTSKPTLSESKPLLSSKASSQYPTIRPTLQAETRYDDEIQERMKGYVYGIKTEENGYWIDKETGKNFLSWPGSNTGFWISRCVRGVRWEDWDVR